MSDRLDWDRIDDLKYQDEGLACRALLARTPLSADERRTVEREAATLVRAARKSAGVSLATVAAVPRPSEGWA